MKEKGKTIATRCPSFQGNFVTKSVRAQTRPASLPPSAPQPDGYRPSGKQLQRLPGGLHGNNAFGGTKRTAIFQIFSTWKAVWTIIKNSWLLFKPWTNIFSPVWLWYQFNREKNQSMTSSFALCQGTSWTWLPCGLHTVHILDLRGLNSALPEPNPSLKHNFQILWLELFKFNVIEQTEEIKTKLCTCGH